MKKLIYFILPVAKISEYISAKTTFGRFSNDGKFLIWKGTFEEEKISAMQEDSDLIILSHDEALQEMQKENWKGQIEALEKSP